MAVEKPNPPVFSFKFQGIFNSSVFSELTEHTERKNDNFYERTDAKDKEVEIDVHQNLTVLSRLAFALKVACEISYITTFDSWRHRTALSPSAFRRLSPET